MKRTERDALILYLWNNLQRLENDLTVCRDAVRYRDADEVDCIELIIARTRLQAFKEFMSDVNMILHIYNKQNGAGD